MSKLKRHSFFIVSTIFAIVCVILALFVEWTSDNIILIVNAPMESLGKLIRGFFDSGIVTGGWCIVVAIGILPLVFPVVKTIIKRKFYPASLSWLFLSAYLCVILYFSINPELLNNRMISNAGEELIVFMRQITFLGMNVIFWVIALICALCEFFSYIKSGKNAYSCAKLIIYAFALGYIFAAFFLKTVSAKTSWLDLNSTGASSDKLSLTLNHISIIFSVLCSYLPTIVTVILFHKYTKVLDLLKADTFSHGNTDQLNSVIKFSKVSVFVTLGSMIANNVLQICLSTMLLSAQYSINFPIAEVLIICLVIIFAEILKRAVTIKDENDLTV